MDIFAPNGTSPVITTGTLTPAANSVLTTFAVAHGLGYSPSWIGLTPKNSLSSALYSVTWDATNITVTYAIAPTTGSLSLAWLAVK